MYYIPASIFSILKDNEANYTTVLMFHIYFLVTTLSILIKERQSWLEYINLFLCSQLVFESAVSNEIQLLSHADIFYNYKLTLQIATTTWGFTFSKQNE